MYNLREHSTNPLAVSNAMFTVNYDELNSAKLEDEVRFLNFILISFPTLKLAFQIKAYL